MSKPLRTLLFAGLISLLGTGSSGISQRPSVVTASEPVSRIYAPPLSVMTYNIKGLPWPVATGREEAMIRIAERLMALRRAGRQPHIVLLQEAFTPEAQAIARSAGYAHAVLGPDASTLSSIAATSSDADYLKQARWDRGEYVGKQVGSGLMILSDYPITRSERMAFPDFACAGFDCLANKGVLLAHVQVPGSAAPVAIVNTHLNARKASGVPVARSQHAYVRQVSLTAQFVAVHVPPQQALVIGGDMNIGTDPRRDTAFFDTFRRYGMNFVAAQKSSARVALNRGRVTESSRDDLAYISGRKKDWMFARPAAGEVMDVALAQVPFGTQAEGPALSDHLGYMVAYTQTRAEPTQLARADLRPSGGSLR